MPSPKVSLSNVSEKYTPRADHPVPDMTRWDTLQETAEGVAHRCVVVRVLEAPRLISEITAHRCSSPHRVVFRCLSESQQIKTGRGFVQQQSSHEETVISVRSDQNAAAPLTLVVVARGLCRAFKQTLLPEAQ